MARAVALRCNALILCMVILLSAVFPAPCWAEWRKGIPRRSNAPDARRVVPYGSQNLGPKRHRGARCRGFFVWPCGALPDPEHACAEMCLRRGVVEEQACVAHQPGRVERVRITRNTSTSSGSAAADHALNSDSVVSRKIFARSASDRKSE